MSDSIQQQVDKLRFHIELIARSIDPDTNPVAILAIDYNWSSKDLNRAHDIFEKYDQLISAGKEEQVRSLEQDFSEEFGMTYQDVKMVVLAFVRSGQWEKVCRAYARSFGPSVPIELKFLTLSTR